MQSTPDTMQHKVPLHSTSLTKWRQRVGAEMLIELLQETIVLAVHEKIVSKHELAQVNVDTTVQEKNITFPTDSKLCLTDIFKLADAAKNREVKLRQTYVRVAKKRQFIEQASTDTRLEETTQTSQCGGANDRSLKEREPDAALLPKRSVGDAINAVLAASRFKPSETVKPLTGERFDAVCVLACAQFLAHESVFRRNLGAKNASQLPFTQPELLTTPRSKEKVNRQPSPETNGNP